MRYYMDLINTNIEKFSDFSTYIMLHYEEKFIKFLILLPKIYTYIYKKCPHCNSNLNIKELDYVINGKKYNIKCNNCLSINYNVYKKITGKENAIEIITNEFDSLSN